MNPTVHGQGASGKIAQHNLNEDSVRELFDSIAPVAGFAFAILGIMFGFGLAVLPSSTVSEKAIVFSASLALSVAGTAGIGAWRSARRFTVTTVSGGFCIILLALLSIAASPGRAHANSSPGAATSAPPLYLAGLTGSGSAWESGPWQLAGTTYFHSLGDPDPCMGNYPDSVTYRLNGSYSRFVATVGVADNANSGDHDTPLAFEVDGNPRSDGSANELGTKSAQWHQPAKIIVPLPKGTTSLTLTIRDSGNCERSAGVWGNARVVS